jgi:hypothetical protein
LALNQKGIDQMNTNKQDAAPPSVADYFEQRLGAKLPPAHPGETELDREHPASPAHPDFHIETGCGEDCKEAIDTAAALITHLRSTDIAAMHDAIGDAIHLLALLRASIPDVVLIGKAHAALKYAHSREYDGGEPNKAVVADIRSVAAGIVNVYVYG